eukprot:7118296-Pyramimonas_sp.AAC.1
MISFQPLAGARLAKQLLDSVMPRVASRFVVEFARRASSRCGTGVALSSPFLVLTDHVFKSVLRTRCSWWCRGRFWASHAHQHPVYSTVLLAVERA